jgi:hypothetical protein
LLWLLAASKKKPLLSLRLLPKLRLLLRLLTSLLRPLRLTLLLLRLLTLPLLLRKLLRPLLTLLLPLRLLLRKLLRLLLPSNQIFSDSKNRPAGRFFFACTPCKSAPPPPRHSRDSLWYVIPTIAFSTSFPR